MKFERYIFICVNRRDESHPRGCCAQKNSETIVELFKKLIAENGLKLKVRANKTGCLDCCEMGPNVMIHPDNVWYSKVTTDDVQEIFHSHILNNKIVKRLLGDFSIYKKIPSAK